MAKLPHNIDRCEFEEFVLVLKLENLGNILQQMTNNESALDLSKIMV